MGTDVQGCIQYIDDVQLYDGLIGQVPWLHYLLQRNPIMPYIPLLREVPGLSLKAGLTLRMAREELESRMRLGGDGRSSSGRDDLLAHLIQGHTRAPDKFSLTDVFSVAHGAM